MPLPRAYDTLCAVHLAMRERCEPSYFCDGDVSTVELPQ